MGIAEINRFLQEKIRELGVAEIEAVPAAALLEQKGLLNDSQHRKGLPLRKLLRAGRIKGAYQYPNARWVIRKTSSEDMYSVKEAAKMLGLSEKAIYKRLEKGLTQHEILGEKSLVIPESEILKEKQQRSPQTEIYDTAQFTYQLTRLKQNVRDISDQLQTIIRQIDKMEELMTNKNESVSYDSVNTLETYGFEGFLSVESLRASNLIELPLVKGVYLVLSLKDLAPDFLDTSMGGRFKEKDPSVDIEVLIKKWIENTIVVYIGQAGGGTSKATLRSRIKQLLDFGVGKPVGHWGGRYLWQFKNSKDLVLCWKPTPDSDPRKVEKELLHNFISHFGHLPFANLKE